jgi:hypothetical protein
MAHVDGSRTGAGGIDEIVRPDVQQKQSKLGLQTPI